MRIKITGVKANFLVREDKFLFLNNAIEDLIDTKANVIE